MKTTEKTHFKLTDFVPFGIFKNKGITFGDIARKEPTYTLHLIEHANKKYTFSDDIKITCNTYSEYLKTK